MKRVIAGCLIAVTATIIVISCLLVQPVRKILANVAEASQASADAAKAFQRALKGEHANGDDGYIVLARRFLQNGDAAMNAIKQTAQDANAIAKAQKSKADDLASRSIELIAAGRDAVAKLGDTVADAGDAIKEVKAVTQETGAQLNDGVLPALKDTLAGTTKALAVVSGPDGLLVQGAASVRSANAIMTDPHLFATFAHIDQITANGVVMGAEINESIGYINNYLKPQKVTLRGVLVSKGLQAAFQFGLETLLRRIFPEKVEIVR